MKISNILLIALFSLLLCSWKNIPLEYKGSLKMTPITKVESNEDIEYSREVSLNTNDNDLLSFKVKITWDKKGRYKSIEGIHGYQLQRYNGKPLNGKQLKKLDQILSTEASRFGDIKLQEESPKANENRLYEIDACSGASVQNKAKLEWISGAGELCYVLWNVVHGSTPEKIRHLK